MLCINIQQRRSRQTVAILVKLLSGHLHSRGGTVGCPVQTETDSNNQYRQVVIFISELGTNTVRLRVELTDYTYLLPMTVICLLIANDNN